jgi:hypothetical protein
LSIPGGGDGSRAVRSGRTADNANIGRVIAELVGVLTRYGPLVVGVDRGIRVAPDR